MKKKSVVCVMAMCGLFFIANGAQANDRFSNNPYFATDSRYDYLYANPPKPRLMGSGRYAGATSRVRYLHSPSRLKGVKHAARINAYNFQAYN